MEKQINGFQFLILEGDRRRWVRIMGAGGLIGNNVLATINRQDHFKIQTMMKKLLKHSRLILDREGEVRVLKSWDLPPKERFETAYPQRIESIEPIYIRGKSNGKRPL